MEGVRSDEVDRHGGEWHREAASVQPALSV